MFSCPKEHLTSLEEFYTLPVPVGMQLQAALERASLSSLFLSLPLLFPEISFECVLCARLRVICTRFSRGSGVFFLFHMQHVAQIC